MAARFIAHATSLALDLTQAADGVPGFFCQLAFVRHVLVEKLEVGVMATLETVAPNGRHS